MTCPQNWQTPGVPTVNVRDFKMGLRLLIDYANPEKLPEIVVVDEVVENADGTFSLTVTPEATRTPAATSAMTDLCHHCGKRPEADGDHTCPCPLTNSECLKHTLEPHPDYRP